MNLMKRNTDPTETTILAIAVAGIFLLSSSGCSKENKKPSLNYAEQRIVAITDRSNNQTVTFSYDEQKRLSRIDYNYDGNPSLRFKYTLPTITAQYYKGAAPDITREKYVFTLLNGNTVNVRTSYPDGTAYDTYLDYDANGRMREAGVRGISSNGVSVFFTMDVYFSYPQDNTQRIKLYGARSTATDTIDIVRTYNPQRRYFGFNNIGFNYFGTFPTGIAYKVAGINDVIVPFPFFSNRLFVTSYDREFFITPATHVLKTLTADGRARDLLDFTNNDWKQVSWGSSFDDSFYQYDEKGRLAESLGRHQFTWQ